MPLEQVLMQIKDDPSLKWLEKMKGDPNKHNRNKYRCFHRDHGHDTDECFDLKQQIENLIRQGKLRNFLGGDHKDEKLKGEDRRIITTITRRNKSYHRGKFNRLVVQVKESIPEGSAERPTF